MCQIHVLGHGIMRSACAVNDNRDQPYRDQLRTSGGDESHQANKLCDVNDTGLISLRGALEQLHIAMTANQIAGLSWEFSIPSTFP